MLWSHGSSLIFYVFGVCRNPDLLEFFYCLLTAIAIVQSVDKKVSFYLLAMWMLIMSRQWPGSSTTTLHSRAARYSSCIIVELWAVSYGRIIHTWMEEFLIWCWQMFLIMYVFRLARQLRLQIIEVFLSMLCWSNLFLNWCAGRRFIWSSRWIGSWLEGMWRVSVGMRSLGSLARHHC